MENQTIQQAANPGASARRSKRGGRCCLSLAGIGVVLVGLFVLLMIMGVRLDRERVSRWNGMMAAIARGKTDQAHRFFAKHYQDKYTPEDLRTFVEKNGLEGHTACEWELGAEDAHGNRIFNGTVTLKDGSKISLYTPVHEVQKLV